MKYEPYWQVRTPAFSAKPDGDPGGHYHVAVIGAGFTGLGAVRKLAKHGASVVVLEAEPIGHGASGRNGGHLNNALGHSITAACARFGESRAVSMYRAFDEGIDTIERFVEEEGIACHFRRSGKLKLASKPAHMAAITRNFNAVHRLVDPDTALLNRDELRNEIGSGAFHGAMQQNKSGMMHMDRSSTV